MSNSNYYDVIVREIHTVSYRVPKTIAQSPEAAIAAVEKEIRGSNPGVTRLDDSFEFSHFLKSDTWTVEESTLQHS